MINGGKTKLLGKIPGFTYKIQAIKLKVIRRTRGSCQLPSYLVILWLRTLKAGKCHAVPAKLSWNILAVQKLRTWNLTSFQQSSKNLTISLLFRQALWTSIFLNSKCLKTSNKRTHIPLFINQFVSLIEQDATIENF